MAADGRAAALLEDGVEVGAGGAARRARIRRSRPVAKVTPKAKNRTEESTVTSGTGNRPGGSERFMIRMLQSAASNPAAPPATDSSRLSVRSCASRRPRLAPRAVRTAISLLPGCGPREQQVGHVGARNEQHQADRGQQDEQGGTQAVRHDGAGEIDQADAPLLDLRELRADTRSDQVHFSLRLARRNAWAQPSENSDDVVEADLAARVDEQRSPNVAGGEERKPRRRDADDGMVDTVERDLRAEGGAFARETAAPEGFADQGDRRRAGTVIAFAKAAADEGLDSKDRQKGGADGGAVDLLRVAAAGQCVDARADRTQTPGSFGSALSRIGNSAPRRRNSRC